MVGWLKLHRAIIEKPIWKSSTPEQKSILITLMCMANHYDSEWEWGGRKYICKPGQMVTSLNSIADQAGKGISIKNVRTALDRFEKLGFLAKETAKTNTLITIQNWDLYQGKDEDQTKGTAKARQTPGTDLATKKEVKNEKMKEKTSIYTEAFELFYSNYPRQQAKAETFRNWNSLLKEYTAEQLLEYANNYIGYLKTVPDDEKGFVYSSNNFFGKKAYFLDFLTPKQWTGETRQKGNYRKFDQRTYDKDYFERIYKAYDE